DLLPRFALDPQQRRFTVPPDREKRPGREPESLLSPMIRLHWAVHSHQPVGNFDFIFERAHAQAYAPFLETLAAHPSIRMSMHFSGILLDWLEAKRPEYLRSLRALVDRGQVEILGGGLP